MLLTSVLCSRRLLVCPCLLGPLNHGVGPGFASAHAATSSSQSVTSFSARHDRDDIDSSPDALNRLLSEYISALTREGRLKPELTNRVDCIHRIHDKSGFRLHFIFSKLA